MIAVAVGEPLLDELGELAGERLVDELLELGTVLGEEGFDSSPQARWH